MPEDASILNAFWDLCTSHEESEFMSTTVSEAWAEL